MEKTNTAYLEIKQSLWNAFPYIVAGGLGATAIYYGTKENYTSSCLYGIFSFWMIAKEYDNNKFLSTITDKINESIEYFEGFQKNLDYGDEVIEEFSQAIDDLSRNISDFTKETPEKALKRLQGGPNSYKF
ncbi:MAG: hypothetical protein KKB03_01175 [Nanoarchaeota archaeon]|nr:hypothetical protein [Nanoarchaeota archaeon]